MKKPKTEATIKAEDNVPPTNEQLTNEIKQEIKKLKKPKRDKSLFYKECQLRDYSVSIWF